MRSADVLVLGERNAGEGEDGKIVGSASVSRMTTVSERSIGVGLLVSVYGGTACDSPFSELGCSDASPAAAVSRRRMCQRSALDSLR